MTALRPITRDSEVELRFVFMRQQHDFQPPSIWISLGIVLAHIVLYSPVLFIRYAFLDDYTILAAAMQNQLSWLLQLIVWEGRPLFALYTKVAFGAAGGLGDLGAIRLVGVTGIGIVSAMIYQALSRTSLPQSVALAAALLFGLTPPFQVYAAWAEASIFAWGTVLAGAAFFACDGEDGARPGWFGFLRSTLLLTAALAVYQPAAMVFWNFAAIAWLLRPRVPRASSLVVACAVMLSSLALDYGLARVGRAVMVVTNFDYARTELVGNMYEKLLWFVQAPLVDSSNIFSISPRVDISVAVAVTVVTGFFLYFGRDFRQTVLRLGIAVLLIPATYIPNLLVAENWSTYRTQVALTGLMLVFLVIGLTGWARLVGARRAIPALCVVAVVAAALAAVRNITTEFAVPQALEYSLVEKALAGIDWSKFGPNDKMCFVGSTWRESFAPIVRYDEFGTVSSSEDWVPEPMAWLILQQHNSPHSDLFVDRGGIAALTDRENLRLIDPTLACREIDLNRALAVTPGLNPPSK